MMLAICPGKSVLTLRGVDKVFPLDLDKLCIGQELDLQLESENHIDKNAVRSLTFVEGGCITAIAFSEVPTLPYVE